jgi:alcohol dehydrogenase, propanol-preferring
MTAARWRQTWTVRSSSRRRRTWSATHLEAVVDGGLVVWVDDVSDDPVGIAIPLPTRERQARSVAGATRRDVVDLIALVTTSPIQPVVETFQMTAAEEALARLRTGRVTGSVVLLPE